EEKLNNAKFHLRDAAGNAQAAAAVVARLDGGEGDPVVHSDVKAALAKLDTADAKLALAANHLTGLPADHPEVKPVKDFADSAGAKLGALRTRLEAADGELGKVSRVNNYPAYDNDLEMVEG